MAILVEWLAIDVRQARLGQVRVGRTGSRQWQVRSGRTGRQAGSEHMQANDAVHKCLHPKK